VKLKAEGSAMRSVVITDALNKRKTNPHHTILGLSCPKDVETWLTKMSLNELRMKVASELKEDEESGVTGNVSVDRLNIHQLRNSVVPTLNTSMRSDVEARVKHLSMQADRELTLEIIDRLIDSTTNNVLYTESALFSAMEEGPADSIAIDVIENVTDISGNQGVEKSSGSTTNTQQGQRNLLDLDKFFSHPILLFKSPILLGNNLDTFLRVWDLYTLNAAVRAKLRNYAYIRGDMKIKIVITGTPFHFGKLLISYQPYDRFNETITSYLASLVFTNDLRNNFMAYLSQAPGACTLDMKDNQPLIVDCPFISTKPMHRLFNNQSTAISAVTSFTDLYNAGALYLMMLNTPDAVTDSSANLSISVYGWMENVELGAPTASVLAITTEADEYKTGPIEKVTTKLAEISGALTRVPEIAPFAYATKMMMSGAAKMASLYGWSKPPADPKPMFVKNMPFTNGANCIGYDTTFKISVDPKQELTVDPRICGTTRDELDIATLCAIESYYKTFTWADSDVAMTPIWSCLVEPWLVSTVTHGAPLRTFVQPTTLAFCAQAFSYWRGEITFRFDFVCSAFHRGKVAIIYEPNIYQNVLINANLVLNKQYVALVDIQETQSASITVQWAAPRAWLKTGVGSTYENLPSLTPLNPDVHNGYITVIPLTRLTSPLEKTIGVNVWVSSKQMEFNFLNEDNFPIERKIVTESLEVNSVGDTSIVLNKSSASIARISEEHFGEKPISFRLLMKRFAPVATGQFTSTAGTFHAMSINMNNVPIGCNLFNRTYQYPCYQSS